MEIIEERGRIPEVHELCSISFEYHYKDSTLSEKRKELYRKAFSEERLEGLFITKKGNNQPSNTRFVCIIDDKLVGTIDLYARQYIRKRYVHPNYLGQGIGTALVNKVIDYTKNEFKEDNLYSNAGLKGIPFWKKIGFIEEGDITNTQMQLMVLDLK